MAPANTVLPTIPATPEAAFNDATPISGWTDLGYASEDGVAITPTLTTSEVNVWQSQTPAKLNVTAAGLTFAFTLMQFSADSTALFFGAEWTTDEETELSTLVLPSNPVLRDRAFLVLWGDADDVYGLYSPRGMVSQRNDLSIGKANASSLGMTITSLDSSGQLGRIVTTADMTPAVG